MTDTATFAAGCFWEAEQTFAQVPGVTATTVGYTGGTVADPSYKEVCTGRTGHAEAVLVEFDPARVSYDELLDVFWKVHDPTTLNRQGPDVGTQYRSAVFFHTPEQEKAALASRERIQAESRRPVVTEVTATSEFHPAEEYHQRYLEKRGEAACRVPRLR